MPQHDFSPLYAHYPKLIDGMPTRFTGHKFILQLARQHQALYVEALYSYRNTIHRGKAAPFQVVHSILSMHLATYTNRIKQIGRENSLDIFDQPSDCACWQKIEAI